MLLCRLVNCFAPDVFQNILELALGTKEILVSGSVTDERLAQKGSRDEIGGDVSPWRFAAFRNGVETCRHLEEVSRVEMRRGDLILAIGALERSPIVSRCSWDRSAFSTVLENLVLRSEPATHRERFFSEACLSIVERRCRCRERIAIAVQVVEITGVFFVGDRLATDR